MSKEQTFDINRRFEDFDEFKQRVQIRKFGYQGLGYDDLSASELKSKAILGDLGKDFDKGDDLYSDLLKGLPVILYDKKQLYKKMYWSGVAGDLDEVDTQDLIQVLSDINDNSYIDPINYKALIIPFALSNEKAWKFYSEELMNADIPPSFLLQALEYVPEVREEVIPLLNNTFGEKFTKAYLENKSLIDRTPLKKDFYQNVNYDMYKVNGFLASFTKNLRFLSNKYGEDFYDYDCISNALKKEGFREEAYELFAKKLADKSNYEDVEGMENAHSNILVRELFPDLVAQLNDVVLKDITKEQIEVASRSCFRKQKLWKECRQDPDLSNLDRRLIRDIINENPDDLDQIKKAVDLFYQMNFRPEIYGSEYNGVYPYILVPLLKKDAPEWMYPVISNAVRNGSVSAYKLGSIKTLFDAAKAWKINPKITKQDAEKIGRMPLNVRIVAGEIFNLIYENSNQQNAEVWNKAEKRNAFWMEMKKAQDMGWRQAILHYCRDNAETRGRILSFYYPEMEDKVQAALRGNMHVKDLVNLDIEEFNHNLELFEKYLGLTKDDIFGHIDEHGFQILEKRPIVKRLVAFSKIFKNEDFKIKFLEQAQKYKEGALLWLPKDMTDEKYESMLKYLSKNLFYNDGTNVEVLRSLESLKDFADMWKDLTPQQEQFDFSKIVGLSYTNKTIKNINEYFSSYKNRIKYEADYDPELNISDNLKLYQKLLLSLYSPVNQKQLDDLMSLDRKQGLLKIAEHYQQDMSEPDLDDARILLDLTIGNDANIGNFERTLIASSLGYDILEFKPNTYKNIVNKIVEGLVLDPKVAELFRKHYVEMVSSDVLARNENFLKVRDSYQSNKQWIVPSAIKAMQCFGNDFDRYMNKVSKYNILQNKEYQKRLAKGEENVPEPDLINIHDALYWLPTKVQKKDQRLIMELIDKHLFYTDDQGKEKHRPLSEFEVIAHAWCSLTPEERKLGYKDLAAIVKSKKYPDAKYVKFANEAARWGVPKDQYKNYEKIYEQGLQVPELIDSSKRFACKNLVGRFLPRDDPRIGFFGKWTDCCQHFDGLGRQCAVSSVKDPFSQLFVVEKEDGSIVAGSWVWESKIKQGDKYYKALCYDNIEAIGDYKSSQVVLDVYKSTLPYLAEQNYATVTVGVGYQDANVDEFEYANQPIPMNKNYSGYTDANTQKVMMYNPEATVVDYNEGDIYITGALAEDIPAMASVCEACFPEGDKELQVPDEDPQGLVLKDQGKVVGYVIWSEKEHSIYDMAVLPQYRKDKNGSSFKLLNETVKRIKKLGGEWSAELRDETSLRYMKAMAGRGLVKMEIGDLDHEMSDGSKVYKVKFSAKENSIQDHIQSKFVPPTNDGR